MRRLGIVEATGLVGRELRDQLEAHHDLWQDLRLFSRRAEGIGTLTEVGGAAAMVQKLETADLDQLDLLFLCDPRPEELDILASPPERLGIVVVSPTSSIPGGRPLLAGEMPDDLRRGEILISPHPAVVGLAHLLVPLEPLGLEEVVATLVRPASMYDQQALEEVFEQTRTLLEFKRPAAGDRFAHQIAFNLLAGPADEEVVVEQLASMLSRTHPRIAVHTLQAGIFHGFSLSVFCQLRPMVTVDDVVAALDGRGPIEIADAPETVGPVDAATRDTVLVGDVRAAPGRPGGFWLWAALDNLTRGGATNALEIARRVLEV